jgi:hypothetical protein
LVGKCLSTLSNIGLDQRWDCFKPAVSHHTGIVGPGCDYLKGLKQIGQLLDYMQLLVLLITYSHEIFPYAHRKYDEWHVALYLIHSGCSNNKVFYFTPG